MSTTHQELELLLPFHANGTLSAEDAALVAAWLAEDEAAAATAADLAAMRADMQAEEIRSPGEFGLARLMRDVERETAAPVATPAAATAAPAAANSPRRPWLWQAVAAVALAAFVGQAYVGLRPGETARYDLASAPAPVSGPSLVVAFAPSATEAEIRDLLLASGVEFIAGPSSLGLYHVGGGDLDQALTALRAAAIVESVENATD